MSPLPALPKPPKGVAYALTCKESVLFTDLWLRSNSPSIFKRVYGIDYAPSYASYNCGAMYWDYSDNNPFNLQLSPELDPVEVAQKFITITARTSRQLVRTAQIVSSPTRWRNSRLKQDLLDDLNSFWDAYEDNLISLNTLWIVEKLVTTDLVNALAEAGFYDEINSGLPSFVVPSEPNWFMLEQQNLAVLKSRFYESANDESVFDATSVHADVFGFIFTPFNLGAPPSCNDIMTRMSQVAPSKSSCDTGMIKDFPKNILRLGELVSELTFWKTERLDAFSLADRYAAPMFKALSDILELPLELIYCMTRNELTFAITCGNNIQIETLKQRLTKHCIAFIDGAVNFYQPADTDTQEKYDCAKSGDILQGLPTSPGVVRGRVRIIAPDDENPVLAKDEIITTKMTRPELGAALDVALAYITDEGGRLCHAAIVSREKRKPCITGLSNATLTLRSGMLIEVDGSVGTVTVIDDCYEEINKE